MAQQQSTNNNTQPCKKLSQSFIKIKKLLVGNLENEAEIVEKYCRDVRKNFIFLKIEENLKMN